MRSRPERVIGHTGTEHGPDSYGRQQWEYSAMDESRRSNAA